MPRRSDKHYLRTHKKLKHLWLHSVGVYGYVSMTEQRQLHDYFRPSEDLTTAELLAHRARISKERPSLPHQAGRALIKFDERAAVFALQKVRQLQPAGQASRGRNERPHLSVRAVVRPNVDIQKLARAFMEVAAQNATAVKPPAGKVTKSDSASEHESYAA